MEEWLDKALSSLHLVTNLKKEGLVNTKRILINQKNVRKKEQDTKAKERVDKYPLVSYIERMKGRNMKTVTINVSGASQSQWSTFLLELNLMKKAWRSYGVDAELKAKSIKKIITLGTSNGETLREARRNSKKVQRHQRTIL